MVIREEKTPLGVQNKRPIFDHVEDEKSASHMPLIVAH